MYEKYLEKINERISDKCDVNYRYKIVQKTIRAIVAYKFGKNAGNNIISMNEVIDIILENQQKYGCRGDLLEELLSEGILTQNVLWNGEEYIYITYERMEDYVYAEMLCEELAQMSVEKFEEKYVYLLEIPGVLNFLYGMSMPDRDACLILILNFILKDKECAINRLLDWGMEPHKNEDICDETIRLIRFV